MIRSAGPCITRCVPLPWHLTVNNTNPFSGHGSVELCDCCYACELCADSKTEIRDLKLWENDLVYISGLLLLCLKLEIVVCPFIICSPLTSPCHLQFQHYIFDYSESEAEQFRCCSWHQTVTLWQRCHFKAQRRPTTTFGIINTLLWNKVAGGTC